MKRGAKVAIVVVGLIGAWRWHRRGGDDESTPAERVEGAGVLTDGFATLTRDVHDAWHVDALDRDGARAEPTRPLRLPGDVRLVGMKAGPAIAWIADRKVKLAVLDGDGNPRDPSSWGTSPVALCEGSASNAHRFGVGWFDRENRVMMVTGQVGPGPADEVATAAIRATANIEWCGIASAGRNIVLAWRERGRTFMNFCDTRGCASRVIPLSIARDDRMLGFGCVDDQCLFAIRARGGATHALRATEKGKMRLSPLREADASATVSIVGAGPSAWALAYLIAGEVAVMRFRTDDKVTGVWRDIDRASRTPPLAWSRDRLLVAVGDTFHILDWSTEL